MKKSILKKIFALLMAIAMLSASMSSVFAGTVAVDNDIEMLDAAELTPELKQDQDYTLADPAPWNLDELKQVVDVKDPRSVAAYFVWSVTRLTANYDDGMEMMKYLFADIEPFGRGYTEGGMSGKAGWDTYSNERLKSSDYNWLPRAYFEGANADNGFNPSRPLTLELYYNNTNTETINAQTLEQLGRLNIVYWVKSHAAGNQVNITVSKFDGSDRWYVTSGTTSTALFYDQRSGLTANARKMMENIKDDGTTPEEHKERYGTAVSGSKEDDNDVNNTNNDVNNTNNDNDVNKTNNNDNDVNNTNNGSDINNANNDNDVNNTNNNADDKQDALPFTDVDKNSVYADGIKWAYNGGVTSGMTETTFGPFSSCTRGQVVTFLWRAAGKPEPTITIPTFNDVKIGDYYCDAVLWAVEQGITSGTSADTFSPDDTCSSAHIITFLYRALGIGSDGWYQQAKNWAASSKMLDGTGISVSPDELCPRGAVVTFLYRAYNK